MDFSDPTSSMRMQGYFPVEIKEQFQWLKSLRMNLSSFFDIYLINFINVIETYKIQGESYHLNS